MQLPIILNYKASICFINKIYRHLFAPKGSYLLFISYL